MKQLTWGLVGAAVLLHCGIIRAQGRTGSSAPGVPEYQECEKAFNDKQYPEAEAKCREAIQLDPAMVVAYVKLGATLYNEKKYNDAVPMLRRCPDQTNVELREQLGLNLYKSAPTPPAEAVTVLEGVVKDKPSAFAAQLQLGLHYYKNDPKKAIAPFEAYLKFRAEPDFDLAVQEKLGFCYLRESDWDAGQRMFETLLKVKPNELNYKLGLGSAYAGKEDCSKAITLYERLLNEAQKQPSIYYNLGKCYLKNNRAADAVREAELYTRAKSTDVKGWVLVGDGYLEEKNYPKALNAFLAAQNLDQTSGAVKTKLGKTYLAQKNYQAALTVLEQAAKAQPNDVDVMCGLAEVYAATNASKDKLSALAGKLQTFTKDAKAQVAAGTAWFGAGNDESAAQSFRSAMVIDPANGAAKLSLVKVLNHRAGASLEKDPPRAQALLEEAARLLPDDLMTNRNLGLVLI
ncbi:MAG TPA: tetratricopeptide repeat protein, partial [Polyangia bacterium]|nr:tetratricopeptide repeat protein [Polyangia bacterium]